MAANLVSPGVRIREVDLTIGRVDQENAQIGAFVGKFSKGPVELPIIIRNEQELISVFGKPSSNATDSEYWLSASNYLSYGGILRVARVFNDTMGNAYAPVGVGTTLIYPTVSLEKLPSQSLNIVLKIQELGPINSKYTQLMPLQTKSLVVLAQPESVLDLV
jgi:hypothetical protein